MRRSSLALAAVVVSGIVAVAPAAGVPEQTPKRGGTVVIGLDGDSCVNPLACGLRIFTSQGPAAGFRHRSRSDSEATTRLERDGDEEAPVHVDVPHSARGSLERPRARDCPRLRLHPRGDPESVGDGSRKERNPSAASGPSAYSARRPFESSFVLVKRAGGTSSAWSCRDTRSSARTSQRSGGTGSSTRRPGGRSAVARFSFSAGSRASSTRWSAIPTTGDRTSPISSGSSCGSSNNPAVPATRSRCWTGSARVSSTSRTPRTPASSPTFGECRESGSSTRPWTAGSTSTSGRALVAIPRFRASSSAERSPTGSIEWRSCGGSTGSSIQRFRPSDSAIFLGSHASYRPNWNAYRYRPAESRRLLEQAGCRRGTGGIYSCAGRRLELRLVTPAGATPQDSHDRARPDAAPTGRHRGRDAVRSSSRALPEDPPERRLRPRFPRAARRLQRQRDEGCLRVLRAREFHGLLPEARDARPRPGRADPRRGRSGPASSTAPTGSWRRTFP